MAVAVGAVVALVGISDGFKRSFLEVYQNRGIDLIVTHPGGISAMNSYLPESLGAKIAAIDGVKWALTGSAGHRLLRGPGKVQHSRPGLARRFAAVQGPESCRGAFAVR